MFYTSTAKQDASGITLMILWVDFQPMTTSFQLSFLAGSIHERRLCSTSAAVRMLLSAPQANDSAGWQGQWDTSKSVP